MTVPVTTVAPGIFTSLANGTGQAAVLNPDYKVNGPNNRASRGDYIMVFLTAGGDNGTDGMIAQGAVNGPAATAKIGGVDAQVLYSGCAPGLVWGMTQVNVIIPISAPTGSAVPLTITIGGVTAQGNVTIGVQ